MIKALIACFNDEQLIQWTLASLVGYVDEIIAVVSSWKYFNDQAPFPSDATVDLLERYGAKVILKVGISEVESRQLLLDQLKPNDWALVIDADETLYNPTMLATLEEHENSLYQVWIYNLFRHSLDVQFLPYLKIDTRATRLFKNTAPLSYHRKHYMLFRGKECLWYTGENYPTATLGIVHWKNFRDEKRAVTKTTYYKKRSGKVLEALGHWSYWLFPTCWQMCKYYFGDMDFPECINIKWDKCNAIPGKENSQTGQKEYPSKIALIYDEK